MFKTNGRSCRGHYRMDLQLPVQSVPINTSVMSLNPVHGEVYSIQHYVIKFVSEFSLGTPVSSNNITDCHNITEILLKVMLNTTTPTLKLDQAGSQTYMYIPCTFMHTIGCLELVPFFVLADSSTYSSIKTASSNSIKKSWKPRN